MTCVFALFLTGHFIQMNGKIPALFPNHWAKSCAAVNITSGHVDWVVDGALVLAADF